MVYRYGGLVRNEDNDSTNPFVEVLLIEIRKVINGLFLDKCSTFPCSPYLILMLFNMAV
ncbi:hypothetical protein ABNIH6_19517, partial [Acinetobacter baumannii ABNIH6]